VNFKEISQIVKSNIRNVNTI